MLRKIFFLFTLVFIFSVMCSIAYADDQTVFGPKKLKVKKWHSHLSFHKFKVDDPGKGVIVIKKNKPKKKIRGGFLFLNNEFISLKRFFRGEDRVFKTGVKLRSRNKLVVFFWGKPNASIKIRVKISHANSQPVADAQFVTTDEDIPVVITLTGSDPEGDALTYQVTSAPTHGTLTGTPPDMTYTPVDNYNGSDSFIFMVNDGARDSEPSMVSITTNPVNDAPVAIDDEATTYSGEAVTINVLANDQDVDGDMLEVESITDPTNGFTTINQDDTITYAPDDGFNGIDTFIYTVNDGNGGNASASITVMVNNPTSPPTVSMSADPNTILLGESSVLSWASTNANTAVLDQGIGSVGVNGSIIVNPEHTTIYTLIVTGPAGPVSAQVTVTVLGNPEPQPEGSFGQLYEGQIPSDATVESYDPKRFSLITGYVNDIDGFPLSDVSIMIHGHPEYGTVFTDATGLYSIPVEGGSTMTVQFLKQGLLAVHRQVYVPWNDVAICETIQMITEDPVSTTITFDGNPNTIVTHHGTPYTDEFGTRSTTMVFAGDNQAYLTDENGNTIQKLDTITTRATLYPIPEAMPAVLPPNSGFTYCVELAVDGAPRVKFDKPVIALIENYLGFDVGEIVPVGYYDRDRGVWVPSDNGIVVRLLDINTDGIVDALDTDGDDLADDLDGDGTYSSEVTGLEDNTRYTPGDTFWFVTISHFTPWDCNWPFGPPKDSIPPNPSTGPDADPQKEENRDCKGKYNSFVEEKSRIYHEDIPIPGTDMTLHYASNRVEGYKIPIIVPASGETVPDSLKKIIVKVEIAGRTFEENMDPLPNHRTEFFWDGLDYLGNEISGSTTAHINIGFVYEAVYYNASDLFTQSFAQAGDNVTGIRAQQEVVSWKNSKIIVVTGIEKGTIAEGWTLSLHHQLYQDAFSPVLLKGDGSRFASPANIIKTVAGNGSEGYSGDGGPAVQAQFNYPGNIALDASGNLYVADYDNHRIRKIDTSGIIKTIAGNGTYGYSGDGGPAVQAQLYWPRGCAVDASGNFYFADQGNNCIRKVNKSGIITTAAGNGTAGYSGDGGPAVQAQLYDPVDVAVDASGNLYIADNGNHRIRKVDTSSIITTVAGSGTYGYSGDGGPAVQAQLFHPISVSVDAFGNIYIADRQNYRIRKVDTSGVIKTIAGNGTYGYSGDGGLAVQAQLKRLADVTMDSPGNLYIADSINQCIRKVDTSGIITTIAGNGTYGYSGDGGPAGQAQLDGPSGMAFDSAENLYIADEFNQRIRKVIQKSGVFTGAITAGQLAIPEANGVVHVMSKSGFHLRTIDLNTGVALYLFSYDQENRLVSITDQFGNEIIIERVDGLPTAIISPDGLRTELFINTDNHLTQITYPDNSHYEFTYNTEGLLTEKIDPNANHFINDFNAHGRLVSTSDDEGGLWQYSRTIETNGDILVENLSAEGNLTSYLDHTDSTGAYTSTITGPTGDQTLYSRTADGLTAQKSLSCGMLLSFQYDVDSEYGFEYVKEMTETTPSGISRIVQNNKIYEDTNADEIPDKITDSTVINGKTITVENNVLQSQNTITSPEGRTITTLYNPATLVTESISVPNLFDTTYAYDPKGRLTDIVTNTRQTSFVYDTQGFLESITDPENHTTTYEYDPMGRVTTVHRPDTSDLYFDYDANGNMTILTNPLSIDHGFNYSKVNLQSSYQTPLSGNYSYVYDRDRQITQMNFPSGKQIDYIYDKTRLQQIQTPEGVIDFTYLCGSKADTLTKGIESITYGYDGNLVTSETLAGTLNTALTYTYDDDFNIINLSYAGTSETYDYDNDGLLTRTGAFSITRNAENGLPEAVNGGALAVSRSFNGYGELDGLSATVNSQNLSQWNLVRDDNGRITQKTETVNGTISTYIYTYDSVGRLLTVTRDSALIEEYEYDANGIRVYETNSIRGIAGRSFAYDDEDHLLTAGTTTYQHNPDGFLTTKTEGLDVTTYDYSIRGELLNVTLTDGTQIEYVHDPLGRRIAKKINGTTIEKYLWQGLTRLLAVYDGSDNLLMRFEYADNRMPVVMIKNGSTYYLTYDQVGSLRIVADSTGHVIKRIDYDSFGNIINDTDPSIEVPFGFAGGLHDRDAGLVRFGYRDYDPDVGRWTAKDPIFFDGGDTDLYGYCLNDPINAVDPNGEILHAIAIVAGVATFAAVSYVAYSLLDKVAKDLEEVRGYRDAIDPFSNLEKYIEADTKYKRKAQNACPLASEIVDAFGNTGMRIVPQPTPRPNIRTTKPIKANR